MAEVSAASIAGSRRALSRSRLRRLTALSRRSPRPVWLPWLRRSALRACPGFAVTQHGVEDGEQLAQDGDEASHIERCRTSTRLPQDYREQTGFGRRREREWGHRRRRRRIDQEHPL